MNIGRNAPCTCGSGMKFKKCCAVKETASPGPQSISSILEIMKFGLEHLGIFAEGAKNVRVREITLINGGDTICCEFYTDQRKGLDIKVEMGMIMGYFSGAFKDDSYDQFNISYFAVRALNEDGEELMFVISSKKNAEAIASGNSVEWLKTSWFQENTPDYRLSRAKTLISDIENALRSVIVDVYKTKYGVNWWDQVLSGKIGDSVKSTYKNQFDTTTSDGEVLIMYTFTLDLKKIVCADWGTFKHLFGKMDTFDAAMVELNVIRREEAHNRAISEQHLIDLERIYDVLLSQIAQHFPDLVLNFMVDNWRSKIKEAMLYQFKPVYTAREFDTAADFAVKRELILKDCTAQIDYLEGLILKLNVLKPPISKKAKHEELVTVLSIYRDLQKEKLDCTTKYEFDNVSDLIDRITRQQQQMDVFSRQFLLEES